jgi:hypothetical protein
VAADYPIEELTQMLRQVENALYAMGFRIQTLTWKWSKLFFLAQLATAFGFCYLCFKEPSSGYTIALMGAAAAVMALREEPYGPEKAVWVVIIFMLLIMELFAIRNDHDKEDKHFTALVRQGLELSQQISGMQRVPEKPNPVEVKQRPAVQGGEYLAWNVGPVSVLPPGTANAGKMYVNVSCVNTGHVAIRSVVCQSKLIIHDGPPDTLSLKAQNDYFKEFLREYVSSNPHSPIVPGELVWHSSLGPVMTADLFTALNESRKVLLIVGKSSYEDASGNHHHRDLCRALEPPVNSAVPAWHSCNVHDGGN